MIFLKFEIDNPFYKEAANILRADIFYRSGKFIFKNKYWEIQALKRGASSIAEIELDLRWRGQDHAGPSIEITIFGFTFISKIYDSRHWDYENNCWEIYTE